MRIAIVGGTLFIGHATAARAVQRGHAVTVIHRGVHPAEVDGVVSIAADRGDPVALAEALRAASPDVVIDTRAMTRADADTMLAAVDGVCDDLVVLSSQDVYAQFGRLNGLDAPDPEPLVTEDSPLTVPYPFRGIAAHAGGEMYDKKDVEAALRSGIGSLRGATALRLPAVYGPRDPTRRFGAIVDALDAGASTLPRQGGAFRWTHGHVHNVAHAIVLAAEARLEGFQAFNVGEARTPTMAERAEAVARALGRTFSWDEPEELPDAFGLLGTMPNDFVSDSGRLREALGYEEVIGPEACVTSLVASLRASRS